MSEIYDMSEDMLSNRLMNQIIYHNPCKWHGYDGKQAMASLVWPLHITKVLLTQSEFTHVRKEFPWEKGMYVDASLNTSL